MITIFQSPERTFRFLVVTMRYARSLSLVLSVDDGVLFQDPAWSQQLLTFSPIHKVENTTEVFLRIISELFSPKRNSFNQPLVAGPSRACSLYIKL